MIEEIIEKNGVKYISEAHISFVLEDTSARFFGEAKLYKSRKDKEEFRAIGRIMLDIKKRILTLDKTPKKMEGEKIPKKYL